MNKKALTLTVIANMTSNYSEGLGNIASVQKVFKNGKVYTMRSRESLKNAIMVQSGMYDDLKTEVDKKTTQKMVNKELNASNCRALEGGYMNTLEVTNIRKSSFYLTDAIACDRFVNETRFHNNLYLATNVAKSKGINIEANLKDSGLMPYQYEYDKSLKIYSITIDLEMIGKDENFEHEENYREASSEEKADRVNSLLNAIENLSLTVKGNLDNAEPVFIVGGLSDRKTHYFENVVKVEEGKLILSEDLQDKI
ncbi:type I-B CRISPR-associated protein Cas7/Cst2/DevR [uncultured Clostridium sp.]